MFQTVKGVVCIGSGDSPAVA